jgi:hypothetical protein
VSHVSAPGHRRNRSARPEQAAWLQDPAGPEPGTARADRRTTRRPAPPRQPIAGTSETPSVTDVGPQTGTGTIVGVIGGYQEGGSTAAISYSPYLGEQVEQLYHQAAGDEAAPAG